MEELIKCPHCDKEIEKDCAQRICSNCFACTGCEIYQCPFCHESIVLKPIRPYKSKRHQPNDKNK